jgi:nucleolar protein 56
MDEDADSGELADGEQSPARGESVRTEAVTGRLYPGFGDGPHPGVLVIHGGGGPGGYERAYAARLAEHGYTVLCVSYFGAPDIPDALSEIPLSYFADAAQWLRERPNVSGERVGVVGFSRGGEAALLAGSHFDCFGVVVAYVPSCYAFPAPTWMDGITEEHAAWTREGDPVPYLPVDELVQESQDGIDDAIGDETANASTRVIDAATDEQLTRARIPVERISGPVLFVSGGEDQAWPSTDLADRACERLTECGHEWAVEHRAYPDAGHAIRVPYENEDLHTLDETHWLGGTRAANAHAAADAWEGTLQFLRRGLADSRCD